FLKWLEEIKKTLGNLGLPSGSALYQVTPLAPDSVPINSLVMFLNVDIIPVSKARVYGTELVVGNEVQRHCRALKSRVWGTIKDFTDDTLFTIFKNSAGPKQNIVDGIVALQKHCQISHQSNINAAKNTLQSLRLAPNKHPLTLLQNIQTQILILADLGYPDSTNLSLCTEFNLSNINNFFTGLTDDDLARSMTALIYSKAKKDPLDFAEDLFGTGNGRSFVAKDVASLEEQIAALTRAFAATRHVSHNPVSTVDSLKLFVVGFPEGTTSELLRAHFKGCVRVDVVKSKNTGKSIAFINYDNASAATAALNTPLTFEQSQIVIRRAFNKASTAYPLTVPIAAKQVLYKPKAIIAYLDSGSEKHLTRFDDLLLNKSKCKPSRIQGIAPDAVIVGSGIQGDLKIEDSSLTLKDVEHVPFSTETLVSIWKLLCEKLDVFFDHQTMTAYVGKMKDGVFNVTARAKGVDGLFHLTLDSPTTQHQLDHDPSIKALLGTTFPRVTLRTWHERFMHAGIDQILKTVPAVHGLSFAGSDKEFFCETCVMAKMPRLPYNKSGWTASNLLDTLIIDVFFPEKGNPSRDGHTCMLGVMVPSIHFKICYGLPHCERSC
ncbi:hypothetical protein HDU99_007330, partial [Rhizoclosmatium hyalinum]